MNYILFDPKDIRENLLPLTYFRPVSEIRCGILTLKEKWESFLQTGVSVISEKYLQEKYPAFYTDDNIYINASVFPENNLIDRIKKLNYGEKLYSNQKLIAFRSGKILWDEVFETKAIQKSYDKQTDGISNIYDIFLKNAEQIVKDFERITNGKKSLTLSPDNTVIGKHPVFIEAGAKVKATIFNTEEAPVYIGKDVVILEGSIIRGPFAALDGSVIKMGAKIYGGTTFGPGTKAGGEIKNVVFFGNANKGHDGYLGDSVIAEWCNLGAGTNNSNLKNNYSNVKLWNYIRKDFTDTGLQFCGMIMGDHSKCGIATMFNTGTVIGVSSNIFGSGFQPKFFPSFKWGGQNYTDYRFDKAVEVAEAVMKRRHKNFDKIEQNIFKQVYQLVKQKEK
jgi:UDP-N-acetylglucosamine diphosphorylase/glucosamine-1-phosphate N-acetyltransferase